MRRKMLDSFFCRFFAFVMAINGDFHFLSFYLDNCFCRVFLRGISLDHHIVFVNRACSNPAVFPIIAKQGFCYFPCCFRAIFCPYTEIHFFVRAVIPHANAIKRFFHGFVSFLRVMPPGPVYVSYPLNNLAL